MTSRRRVSEAWAIFGPANDPDPVIRCLVLRNVFFALPGDELAPPKGWGRAIVQGKTYDVEDRGWDWVSHAFQVLAAQPRIDTVWDSTALELNVRR